VWDAVCQVNRRKDRPARQPSILALSSIPDDDDSTVEVENESLKSKLKRLDRWVVYEIHNAFGIYRSTANCGLF